MGTLLNGCTNNYNSLIKVWMFKTSQMTVNTITKDHKFLNMLPVKDQNHGYCDKLKKIK